MTLPDGHRHECDWRDGLPHGEAPKRAPIARRVALALALVLAGWLLAYFLHLPGGW